MKPQRHLTAIFCDDVRKEEGNKLSYMGVYTGLLGVVSFPAVLPRLCFVLTLRTSPDMTPSQELRFRLLKDNEIIAENVVPAEALASARSSVSNANIGDDRVSYFATIFQLFPVPLSGPGFFRARAICDGEELKGDSLAVIEQKDFDQTLRALNGQGPLQLLPEALAKLLPSS